MRNSLISLLRRPRPSIARGIVQEQTKKISMPMAAKMSSSQQNTASGLAGKQNHWGNPGSAVFDFRSKQWERMPQRHLRRNKY